MTCDELLAIAREGRPNVRYTANKQQNTIGAWVESLGRFVSVACLTIKGDWVSLPYELNVNGQPLIKPEDWITDDHHPAESLQVAQ